MTPVSSSERFGPETTIVNARPSALSVDENMPKPPPFHGVSMAVFASAIWTAPADGDEDHDRHGRAPSNQKTTTR